MKKLLLGNLFKNIVILIALIVCYPIINNELQLSGVADNAVIGNVLIAVSILCVTACFGAFAFSYEKTDPQKTWITLISHLTTGLLMFIIGISLEISSLIVELLIPDFTILKITWLLLYIGVIAYDFWDLTRVQLYK